MSLPTLASSLLAVLIGSTAATPSRSVDLVNHVPVAADQSVTVPEDTDVLITLSAADEDADTLSFTFPTQTAHGLASKTGPNTVRYHANYNYFGTDSFTFTASDGQASSQPATVWLTITPVNDSPTTSSEYLGTGEETAVPITLHAADVDGDPITFTLLTSPAHGTLSGTPPLLTYTPAPDYYGIDSFAFAASDGMQSSRTASDWVTIIVAPIEDPPVARALALTVPSSSPTAILLEGIDVDGDQLVYTIVSSPGTGTLTGAPPDVLYTPAPGFTGTTHFTFSVSDGQLSSSADVLLTVEERSLTVSAAANTLRPTNSQEVRFYANAVDEAGAPISLQWDFGDGQSSQDPFPVHAFQYPRAYDVRLKATTMTEEATTLLRIWVRDRGSFHVPRSPTTLAGVEGAELTVDPDYIRHDGITWTFGDGTSANGGYAPYTATHVWRDNGTYLVRGQGSRVDTSSPAPFRCEFTLVVYNTPPVPLPQERRSATVGQQVSVQLSGTDAAGVEDPLHWELVRGEGSLTPEGLYTWTPSHAGLTTVFTKLLDGDGGESRLAFQIDTADVPAAPGPEPEPTPEPVPVPVPVPVPHPGSGCGASAGGAPGGIALGLVLLWLATLARGGRGAEPQAAQAGSVSKGRLLTPRTVNE